MVPQMGGFPKTFRCIAAALLHKSTAGNLIERTFLLTELFVHRHVFDSFCVERNAAVFKITSFAIACQLSCRLIIDAATPCGTGFFMVLLHGWFELFGMKILMIGTNGCHQHQGKEHHSHHDHWSNKKSRWELKKCRIWQGTWHLINSKAAMFTTITSMVHGTHKNQRKNVAPSHRFFGFRERVQPTISIKHWSLWVTEAVRNRTSQRAHHPRSMAMLLRPQGWCGKMHLSCYQDAAGSLSFFSKASHELQRFVRFKERVKYQKWPFSIYGCFQK